MNQERRVTIKELAEELGLSTSVVSRVLNGKGDEYRISRQAQEAVRAVADKRGFSANRLARGLRLKKTETIGLLIPDISNDYFAAVAQSVEFNARKRGYSVILCDTEEDERTERRSIDVLRSRSVDGLLVVPVGLNSDRVLYLARGKVPVVQIDRHLPGAEVPYVISDNAQGAYEGASHLLKRGHRTIGFVQGIPDTEPNRARLEGYRRALDDFNIPFEESLVAGRDFGEQNGFDSSVELIDRNPDLTALFVTSAVGALGAMRACRSKSLCIPEDISIVGFDDYPYAALLAPPLTTIAQQTQAMGRLASDLLLDWIELGRVPDQHTIVLGTRLVPRSSVADRA